MIPKAQLFRVRWALGASVAVVAVALALVAPNAATAQTDPYNPAPAVTVSYSSVCAGTEVQVTVSGFDRGDTVIVNFAGQTETLTTNSNGSATTTLSTHGLSRGSYPVEASSSTANVTSQVTILDADACSEADSTGGDRPDLPRTGNTVFPLAATGAALVAGGAFLLWRGRRRSTTA